MCLHPALLLKQLLRWHQVRLFWLRVQNEHRMAVLFPPVKEIPSNIQSLSLQGDVQFGALYL